MPADDLLRAFLTQDGDLPEYDSEGTEHLDLVLDDVHMCGAISGDELFSPGELSVLQSKRISDKVLFFTIVSEAGFAFLGLHQFYDT